ncbi:MAG: Outer rane lipoprotein carrier protein LolA [Myxococcaceae bacterium]|jgi:outer membrane lipoprotein carrier protein|nr:Outer rane lipoprotein carrier protein LolA [Myxococcaceae bacterium]
MHLRRLHSLLFAGLLAAALPMIATDSSAQATSTALPADQAQQVLTKVQNFYDKTTSFSSDFTQEFFVKSHNVKKQSKGHVTFAKPGKMFWEYSLPQDNRVVSDGAVLKVYEAANKQMFEQNVDKSQYPAALSFLVGGGKLSDTFTFELFEGTAMNFAGGQVLVGTPKTPSPAYQKVLFYIDGPTSQVRRVLIVDGQGNRNRFDFDNPKVNETIPADRFKFVPPPGTQVIRP